MSVTISMAGVVAKTELRSMLSSYLAELGAYGKVNFDYPYFDAYWSEGERRWPYLIRAGSDVIGFAFVRAPSDRGADYSLAEFYIRPEARGCGRGIEAAKAVLTAYPGVWYLTIFLLNAPAQAFWPKAIAAAGSDTPECSEEHGEMVYRFVVPK